MADDVVADSAALDATASPSPLANQLTQVRVPLSDTAEALSTPDSAGRLPIIVLPEHALRIRNEFVVAGLIAIVVGLFLDLDLGPRTGLFAIGGLLIVLGVFRSFRVPVPEGSRAILLKGGKFSRTLGPGNHWAPPWIIVSHIVTSRETPFDAIAMETPTSDDVRTNVDILMTFRIESPEKFVFTISAPDFDQICQATCQQAVRLLVRDKTSDGILDMRVEDADRLRTAIGAALEPYGVLVVRVVVTHVLPPLEFIASRESRRLATLQRAEEQEQHALALVRQKDKEELLRVTIEARREAIELEAANEVARLERLEARIRDYPNAMHWDVESQRLEVARSLAGNTRAMVSVGQGGDVASALIRHTLPEDGLPPVVPAASDAPDPGTPPPQKSRR